MNKQFLSLIAAGSILGGASQIKAMDMIWSAIQSITAATGRMGSQLGQQRMPPLPHFPDKISTNLPTNPDYTDVRALPFIAGIHKKTEDKNLIDYMGSTPQAIVYFGARNGKVGYCVYGGKVETDEFDFMEFIPSGHQPDAFWQVKGNELTSEMTPHLNKALAVLEITTSTLAHPEDLPDVKAAQ